MTVEAAAAFRLAKRHGVEIAMDGGGLIMRSDRRVSPVVRAALRKAKPDLLAALRADALLERLRQRGFEISLTGSDRDLRDIVVERRPLFERLLAWSAPDRCAEPCVALSRQ